MLAGIIGGITGVIMVLIGILWSLSYAHFLLVNLAGAAIRIYFETLYDYVFFIMYYIPYPSFVFSFYLFVVFSILIAIFLIVAGILTGIGYYGIYKISGEKMSLVNLILSCVGTSLGALLILTGTTQTTINVCWSFTSIPIPPMFYHMLFLASLPNWSIIQTGILVLGANFILLGSVSIYLNKMKARNSGFGFAGVSSIIGGILLVIGIILLPVYSVCQFFYSILGPFIIVSLLGLLFIFLGFGVMLLSFIFWTQVFHSFRKKSTFH